MSSTPRKLRLNTHTLRKLTNVESAEVVGGTGGPTNDGTCSCGQCTVNISGCPGGSCVSCVSCGCPSWGCPPPTGENAQCCVDLTFSALRLDF